MSAVNRVEVLKTIRQLAVDGYVDGDDIPPIEKAISEMTSVPTTAKGHWNEFEDAGGQILYKCKCGFIAPSQTNFCPHCGCYMKEAKNV